MTTRLQEIRARLDGATKGPWEAWNGCSWWRIGRAGHQGDRPVIEPTNDRSDGHPNLTGPNLRNDLDLIAHAPTDLAFLLERVEVLEKALREAIFVASNTVVADKIHCIAGFQKIAADARAALETP